MDERTAERELGDAAFQLALERRIFGIPDDLSDAPQFVRSLEVGRNHFDLLDMWDVSPTGIGELDAITGKEYADQLIRWARKHENPHIISYVMAVICTREVRGEMERSQIENGFFNRLAALAYVGSAN